MVRIGEIEDKNIWEKFVLAYPQASFLHSWYWGKMQEQLGKKILRFGLFSNNKLNGVFLLIKQEAKRAAYLECPGGPLLDWANHLAFDLFIKHIKETAREENCQFIRVRPQLLDTAKTRLLFKKKGFFWSAMHLHAENTLQLDLRKSNEQLLKEMRKNTRYLIKKAQKYGVKIIQSKKVEDIALLYQLQLETVQRQKFVPFSQKFFEEEFKAFLAADKIRLFKASFQGKVLAASLIIFYGKEAVYHYSGSSCELRKIPASYLLQWEAIQEARRRGCCFYNFWGISPSNNLHHRFAGVTLFKKGFGGQEISYLHAQDYPVQLSYAFTFLFETFRKIYRRL